MSNNLGIDYGEKGEYDLAIKYFTKAIKLKLDYAIAYNNRGAVYRSSGVIESACKHVVGQRCKLTGMRWSKPGINAILFWRCLLKNDTSDTYWDTQDRQNAA